MDGYEKSIYLGWGRGCGFGERFFSAQHLHLSGKAGA
jgi:hypothetical protein